MAQAGPNPEVAYAVAIETSGRLGSVALSQGHRLIEAADLSAQQRHAVELLPVIASLFSNHRIDPSALAYVYVSAGPGSFTGLRVGMTVARTLSWAAGANVVRVPTLDVVAQNAMDSEPPPSHVAVLLDAKRRHVFAATFERRDDGYRRLTEPAEWDVAKLAATLPAHCALLGEGIPYHAQAVAATGLTVLPESFNRARAAVVHRLGYALARQGRFEPTEKLVPIYVRRPEAEEVWEQRYRGKKGNKATRQRGSEAAEP
ncbi:MAG: tRNA (adenosine(37)-N6)-threonylcarbamoyltransferase complex dimerization subunit type 1 TsaB [Phycisphaerae bacterium]